MTEHDAADEIGDDFEITSRSRHAAGSGIWITGRLNGHRFDALVFPEHAEDPEWEIDQSRISKLWLQRLADRRTVFNWDRGADVEPANAEAAALVAFLTAGLAEFVFGG